MSACGCSMLGRRNFAALGADGPARGADGPALGADAQLLEQTVQLLEQTKSAALGADGPALGANQSIVHQSAFTYVGHMLSRGACWWDSRMADRPPCMHRPSSSCHGRTNACTAFTALDFTSRSARAHTTSHVRPVWRPALRVFSRDSIHSDSYTVCLLNRGGCDPTRGSRS
eukprot:6465187-Prymnesium_polylepis.1